MSFKQIRDNIATKLETISGIQNVYKNPQLQMDGYPGAFVAPSGNESDYDTTQENMRIYAFKIYVVQEYDQTDYEDAYNIILELVDTIIDQFDKEEAPSATRTLDDNLDSKYTLVAVEAVPGIFASDRTDKLLACEITIRCKTLVDLAQIA